MNNAVLKYLVVMLATALLVRAFAATAIRIGLIDHPGGRKRHEGAVPLTGGLAMFAGFGFGALFTLESLLAYRALFAALGLLVIVGLLDDMRDLSPGKKFAAQIVAALFMTSWGAVTILQLGNLFGFGLMELRGWSIPFTVICVLGTINAVNMADGVDGLAGGLSLVGLLAMAAAAVLLELPASAQPLLLMAAAVAGFLVFNMRFPWQPRARAFMGDAGSMMLGFFLTWFAIELTQGRGERLPPIVAVWFLAVPLLDMGLVTVRRLLKGSSPFRAGRDHLHHVLLFAGFSPAGTAGILLSISALLAAGAMTAWRLGVADAVLFYAFMGLFGVYYLISMRAWRLVRFVKRLRHP